MLKVVAVAASVLVACTMYAAAQSSQSIATQCTKAGQSKLTSARLKCDALDEDDFGCKISVPPRTPKAALDAARDAIVACLVQKGAKEKEWAGGRKPTGFVEYLLPSKGNVSVHDWKVEVTDMMEMHVLAE
jgi:hypothetical protein